jgi:cytochrome c biogenesis protein CcmG/thiol:disulfide interchange protein DsbE
VRPYPPPRRRSKGRALLLWLIAAVVALSGCAAGPGSPDAAPAGEQRVVDLRAAAALPPCPSGLGQALPDLTLPCLSGGPDVPLTAAGTGRPTLVNVWATWCAPCVREVPLLVEAAAQGTGKLDVVGVLTQDTPVNGLEFARQFEMSYTSVLDDDGAVMRRFSPGPPVTLFVSPAGEIEHVKRGEFKDADELRQLLVEHLDVELATP